MRWCSHIGTATHQGCDSAYTLMHRHVAHCRPAQDLLKAYGDPENFGVFG